MGFTVSQIRVCVIIRLRRTTDTSGNLKIRIGIHSTQGKQKLLP